MSRWGNFHLLSLIASGRNQTWPVEPVGSFREDFITTDNCRWAHRSVPSVPSVAYGRDRPGAEVFEEGDPGASRQHRFGGRAMLDCANPDRSLATKDVGGYLLRAKWPDLADSTWHLQRDADRGRGEAM
jgi:hypothetical protein